MNDSRPVDGTARIPCSVTSVGARIWLSNAEQIGHDLLCLDWYTDQETALETFHFDGELKKGTTGFLALGQVGCHQDRLAALAQAQGGLVRGPFYFGHHCREEDPPFLHSVDQVVG